jgi:Carboxypeptidase regulatory-like domain
MTRFPMLAPAGLVVVLSLVCAFEPALASSVCGIVRDEQTLQPVPHAAVFLYDNLDQYTGLYAGTDVAGHYCIDNVANGTYTIQVRVDDYLAAVVRNIIVNSATSVDVATRAPVFLGQPWPNPASSDIVFDLRSPGGTPTQLDVYDVSGRLVMGWRGDGDGDRSIHWNLRDASGSPIASGIYLVRLRAGGTETVRRFVRLR